LYRAEIRTQNVLLIGYQFGHRLGSVHYMFMKNCIIVHRSVITIVNQDEIICWGIEKAPMHLLADPALRIKFRIFAYQLTGAYLGIKASALSSVNLGSIPL